MYTIDEIRKDIELLALDIALEYDIERIFYKEFLPNELVNLEKRLELCTNEHDYLKIMELVAQLLRDCVLIKN